MREPERMARRVQAWRVYWQFALIAAQATSEMEIKGAAREAAQREVSARLDELQAALELQERQRHWQALTPGGRAVWGWPSPGAALDPEAPFPSELPDGAPLPEHFQLLRIALSQVELLELTAQPHRRRRWRVETRWSEESLNP